MTVATERPSRFASYPSLDGKVAFLTGGATGIGAEIVAQLAAQGARVGFVDIDESSAGRLAERLAAEGYPRPVFRGCDVKDVHALQAAISAIGDELGPITVLVNNAGNDQRHRLEDLTPELWDERLAVNLRHHVFAVQAVLPVMRSVGGGSIINIGSITAHLSLNDLPAYSTANGGIESLTRALAHDLGADAIRVNCVIPGWILTERQRRLWLTPEAEERLMQAQCIKELLGPEDVARLVLWLAADDSLHCSRQCWIVDGGWM